MASTNNKRLVKNTTILYLRMVVVMLVSLYTTRVVLETLGEANYGIYNVIGGVVVLFAFLNHALAGATQRYLSFALGKNDSFLFNRYYSASFISYIALAIIIIFLAETLGLWFINNKLTIPSGRMEAANIVYQFSLVTFVINLLRIPLEASVIAHERMSLYAYLSIIDVILKLGIVFLLLLLPGDKLIDYAALMILPPIVIFTAFAIFCHKTLGNRFIKTIEKDLLNELFSYSSWTLLGSISNVAARQGGNIIINIFGGVVVNAAVGIANQVSAAVSSLVGSFQTAFRPQIIKLYASRDKEALDKIVLRTSSWSYYLMLAFVVPITFNLNEILSIWLVEVPPYTNIFIILLFFYCLIDAIQTPVIVNITATANIKIYEIWISILIILNLPITFCLFKLGLPVYYCFITYTSINLISAIIRTIYAKSFVNFPAKEYLIKVIYPALYVSFISFATGYLIYTINPMHGLLCIINLIIIFILTSGIILFLGFNKNERKSLIAYIRGTIFKRFKTNIKSHNGENN